MKVSPLLLSVLVAFAAGATPADPATNAVARPAGTNLFAAVTNVVHASGAAHTNALGILRAADRARGNLDGIRWSVTVRTVENGKPAENVFDVKARGFNVLAEQTAPRRSKGSLMLVNQGNMWFYKPGTSKPVPISTRQKLAGNVANGDIATTNYADDYTPTFLPDAVVSNELCYVLNLSAKSKRCTYDRIVYYISQARGVGVKAEYYTVSGKLFKTSTMQYAHTVTTAEGPMPFISYTAFASAIATEDVSSLEFSAPTLGALAPSTFDVNRLIR